MNLATLNEMIRAIRMIAPTRKLILFGSSSILASFPHQSPDTLGVEVTIDADLFLDPDDLQERERLQKSMGQGRDYHLENGFYCDFVDARADEWFPPNWRERLVLFPGQPQVSAMHPVDAAAAKLVATAHARVDKRMGRRQHDRGLKDIETVVALVRGNHVDLALITASLEEIPLPPAYRVELAAVLEEVNRLIRQPAFPPRPTVL